MSNPDSSAEKPVDEWVTGSEPMTGPQRSYLETLAREAGEEVPDELTKAEASQMIERLQKATGRSPSPSGESRAAADDRTGVEKLAEEGIVDQQAAAAVEPDSEQS
ncbi:MAG TPA: DUF3072 domain-containing protein [Ilumatobacter sp.]|jgi:hypothetical protein|nr:DUF3072 domain-containing protein [Ilumatobacter sp.]